MRHITPGIFKIRLRKGDTVIVRAGKDKGKTGQITAVHPALNKVTVEGVNMVTRHVKPNRTHPQGDRVKETRPIWVSKVSLIDPASKKPSRIAYRLAKDGAKVRVYAKSGKDIK